MALYRALLRLYPASFRAEYGEEMTAIFARRRRDTAGLLPTFFLWLEALSDSMVNAARAHEDILRQDLAFAARTVRRSPGFAFTTIVVAALGIGATTAAFSITYQVLMRPLPFFEPERLAYLWENNLKMGYGRSETSPLNYRDWKAMNHSFEDMGAFGPRSVNLGDQGQPARIDGTWVTSEIFPILRVRPSIGRVIGSQDGTPGAPAVIVLGYGLWQSRFSGDERVLGAKILLDDAPHIVVGVMPPAFHFPNRDAEIWISRRFEDAEFQERNDNYLRVLGRLKSGISISEARADMKVIAGQLERAYPDENASSGVTVNGIRDELPSQARLLPIALLGAATCVLLIACANLTTLLLGRAMVRRKELAVRATLGAGRERLIRQLMTESLVLAFVGGTLGVLIAASAAPILARLAPQSLPIAEAPSMDLRILAFALTLTSLTGIAFGVLPALRACGETALKGLQEGSRGASGGRREHARSALVVAEVTASVVLLVCCGLLLRALSHVEGVDPGFRGESVLTLRTTLPLPRYGPTATRYQFYSRVLSEVRALPGVEEAAYVTGLPMVRRGGIWGATVPGEVHETGTQPTASARFASPGFFKVMGIPLIKGRDINDNDTREAPPVAVVSESFVKRHWPGEDPIGREFRFGPALGRRVAGVVGDIRVRGLEQSSEPQVYLSYQQVADNSIIGYIPGDLVIRTTGQPLDLLPSLRTIIRQADPQQPISDVRLLSDIVEGETAPRRVQVRVLGAFAAAAFVLAAIGLHGLLSFAVSSRTQEIGVRIALGAQSADILRTVLRESLRMAAVGLGLGLILAYAAGRGMEALLAGVRPADAETFIAATGLALLMTLAGSLLPAYRAVRVNPIEVMRSEP